MTKPLPTRQKLASLKAMRLAGAALFLAAELGGFEIHEHTWSTFIDRPPGVGATANNP